MRRFYLHFINSVDTNYQCNSRGGREMSKADSTYARARPYDWAFASYASLLRHPLLM